MAGFEQILGHRRPHDPHSDETKLHDNHPSLRFAVLLAT
jgi:hypothetical protein